MSARRVLLALGLAIAAAGVVVPASPAGASSTSVADPRGDGHGAGDIRGVRVSQAGSNLLLQVRTQNPLDVTTAPAWTNKGSLTFLRFNIDADGGAVDHVVLLTPGPSGPSVEYDSIAHSPAPRRLCAYVTQPELTLIRVNLAISCLSGTSVRVFARYGLDQGGNASLDSDDRAPNAGWVPTLGLN